MKKSKKDSYHHPDLRSDLVKAVLTLVQKKGARGFSLNEASRLAGVSVAAPYRHFADKDALLAEVAREGNELMARELREASSKSELIEERFMDTALAYIRFAKVHRDYFAVMFGSGIDKSHYPEVVSSAADAFSIVLGLSNMVEKTPALALDFAVTCWGLTHGLAMLDGEGALAHATQRKTEPNVFRAIFQRFLDQRFQSLTGQQ